MIHDDLTQLRQLLARAVQASGMKSRALERELGIGSGALRRLLEGGLDLKVEYLTRLARLLRIPAGELLAAGCPEANAAPRHRLADWLGPAEPTVPTVPTAAPPAPPSPEELAAMVRAAVREELAARQGR
jgi:transcriptional regulator with XRE-family HTH domain